MTNSAPNWLEPPNLGKITCTSAACDRDLHNFMAIRPKKQQYRTETCRECGADLVDWARIDSHNLSDVNYTVEALQHELIRCKYWRLTIHEGMRNQALRKGRMKIEADVDRRLASSIGHAHGENAWDGRQTPLSGTNNIIHYAQHATATCCRRCTQLWHRIPMNRPLTDGELTYLGALAKGYILRRLPDLPERSQHVPPIRRR